MKPDKIRELYSGIDTDISMDHRIKNRLLYYDHLKDTDDRNRYLESYERSSHSSAISKLRKLRPLLPSMVILMFIAIVLIGIRANLFSWTPEHDTVASTGQDAEGSNLASWLDNLLGDDEATDTALKEEEQGIMQEEAVLTEDTLNQENGSEGKSSLDGLVKGSVEESEEPDMKTENSDEKMPETSQDSTPKIDTKTEQAKEPSAGDFLFAYFFVVTEGSVKANIPSLVIRFHGNVKSIDPADLTDIVLTRDGVPIENSITTNSRRVQFTWGYEEVTDFYFDFVTTNMEPGNYNLVGNYKGVPFDVYNKIIEETLTEEPADSGDLRSVGWMYKPDKKDEPMIITELVFYFEGLQNAYYVTDISDLKATVNGNEIPIAFEERIFRYYEANDKNTGDTSFNLIIKEPFSTTGTYVVSGKYRDVPFTSMEITIP